MKGQSLTNKKEATIAVTRQHSFKLRCLSTNWPLHLLSSRFSTFFFMLLMLWRGATNDIYSPPPTPFRLILQSPICHRLPSLFAFEIPAFPAIFPYLGASFSTSSSLTLCSLHSTLLFQRKNAHPPFSV